MALTERSNVLQGLQPIMRRAIEVARVPESVREDALQMALESLTPYIEKLRTMAPQQRAGYAFQATSAIAYRVRDGMRREDQKRVRDVGPNHCHVPAVTVGVPADDGRSAHDAFVLKERERRMNDALTELTRDDLALVARLFGEELSEREAATRLQVSRGAIVRRARSFREELKRAWLGTTSWFRSRK